MNLDRLRITGLIGCAAFLLLSVPRMNAAIQGLQPQEGSYGQDRDWNRPPDAWNDVQRRGFHDGIEGAQKDYDNHRRPDVDNRDEYRRPNLPSEMWGAYREGFRRGYDVGMSHLVGAREQDRPWDAPPDAFDATRRQGFQDGIVGARKDVDNHRRPDVNNRDEYRRPNVPPQLWEAYREGFQRGYDVGMSHLMGAQGYTGAEGYQMRSPVRPWDAAPPEFDALRQQGFRDGIVGARKDFDNHRRPDVNNRDEYRNPHLPPEEREAYRDGFRRGYQVAVDHIMGGHGDDHDHDHY